MSPAIAFLSAGVTLASLMCSVALPKDVGRRAFEPADVHRTRAVDDIALSPDGKYLGRPRPASPIGE